MQVTEHISQSVKGRTLVRADLSLGYDFQTGLTVEAFYGKGFTDLLEVGVNSYNITEHRNDSQYIGVSIGWILLKSGISGWLPMYRLHDNINIMRICSVRYLARNLFRLCFVD